MTRLRDMPELDVTRLLIDYREGNRDAFENLVATVHEDLRRVARAQLRTEPFRDTLDTAALVHESYLRLADLTRLTGQDRARFFAIAAVAMRRLIVDYARERAALTGGGPQQRVPLDDGHAPADAHALHVIDVHDALSRLQPVEPTLAQVVDCRFFAGYSDRETAEALGLSVESVQRAWARARAWLQIELR
jgi:RNA polymerase sigma factor (TIGR02999 family)